MKNIICSNFMKHRYVNNKEKKKGGGQKLHAIPLLKVEILIKLNLVWCVSVGVKADCLTMDLGLWVGVPSVGSLSKGS